MEKLFVWMRFVEEAGLQLGLLFNKGLGAKVSSQMQKNCSQNPTSLGFLAAVPQL